MITIKSLFKATLFTSFFGLNTTFATAEQLSMPTAASNNENITLPYRGLSKGQVISQFGEPISQNGPSGTPPIYFWDYADFTVYFESDYVIHSVNKHQKLK